jgi:hypothetical protein
MKKILLSILSLAVISVASAQVPITLDGSSTDISGTTYDHELTNAVNDLHVVDFIVHNDTGSDQPWMITRVNMPNPAGWQEYICWGVDGDPFGQCYAHDPNPIWSSSSVTIPADSAARLTTYITAPSGGTGIYRYYVSTDGVNFLDSIDLRITYAAGLDENSTLSINVSPNPATDYINVSVNSNDARLKVADLLGNIVYTEDNIGTTMNLNVKEYRNGVYFIVIDADGVMPVTRKVIVKH